MSYLYRCDFCGSTSNPLFTSSIGNYICSFCMHDRQADRYDASCDRSDNITYIAKKGKENGKYAGFIELNLKYLELLK